MTKRRSKKRLINLTCNYNSYIYDEHNQYLKIYIYFLIWAFGSPETKNPKLNDQPLYLAVLATE